ncbi:MAG: hypothetical protein EAZ76_12830 [Nostocales cyanobacterium]|nr:MAG: hypothetical protein EAZ87_13840 [Nostocales cyanobacterium]TAF12951.1 MAG: hypothetical protein EAZ76_12830 [Nostocales cyanobacterium]
MKMPNQRDKDTFLYPRSCYYGRVKPQNLVFNANLQIFSQKVAYITADTKKLTNANKSQLFLPASP